jgi:hypothetical protein
MTNLDSLDTEVLGAIHASNIMDSLITPLMPKYAQATGKAAKGIKTLRHASFYLLESREVSTSLAYELQNSFPRDVEWELRTGN